LSPEGYRSDLISSYLSEKENKKIEIKLNNFSKVDTVFIPITNEVNKIIKNKPIKERNRADKLSITIFKTGSASEAIEIANYVENK